MNKEKSHDLEMLFPGLPLESGHADQSIRGTSEDAAVQALCKLQNSDSIKAWLRLQWEILRAAGLLR
jgi:hypothetical protein